MLVPRSTIRQMQAIAEWLVSYRMDRLGPDVIAGLTAAAVIILQSMAYATIAGLADQIGLYSLIFP